MRQQQLAAAVQVISTKKFSSHLFHSLRKPVSIAQIQLD
jgi:hypothetical protein